ncbi:MAG: glycoside hydrolase family 32 protein [Anaerolineae bacterium]
MPGYHFSTLTPADYLARAATARRELAHDPQRPRYHFAAPANWLNDPNGLIQWRGLYHLFYQSIPDDPVDGAKWWGHAVSTDLVHWQDRPLALAPSSNSPDQDGIWSGCALAHDGRVYALYTGLCGEEQRPCLAWAKDDSLDSWDKFEGNPLFEPPAGVKGSDFRDHSAWREGDDWYQVIGSGIGGVGGAAQIYRSRDLRQWEYCGPLCRGEAAETGVMWECPSFFALDGGHVLMTSPIPFGRAIYMSGDYAEQHFTPRLTGEVDTGGCFYAPQTFADESGRRIMFGWLWETLPSRYAKAAGWAGVMSLPRVLSLAEDGTLRQAPAPEVESLRGEMWQGQPCTLSAGQEMTLPVQGDCLELGLDFQPGSASSFGVAVRYSPDGAERTLIGYDTLEQELYIDRAHSSLNPDAAHDMRSIALPLAPGETLRLRIFLDASVVEVFANERVVLASRVYPVNENSQAIYIDVIGGSAYLERISAWQMSTIF